MNAMSAPLLGAARGPLTGLGQGLLIVLALVQLTACSPEPTRLPPGAEADRFLLDQGNAELEEEEWIRAREFFQQLLDSYPQSSHRMEAKLGLGDSFFGRDSAGNYVVASAEYREFLTFYPSHEKAGYAQYRLGLAAFNQMRRAERDQTQTRQAITEFELFVERYPNNPLMEDVQASLREAKDRLSESEYLVGYFYFRQRWYPGAITRFRAIIANDPGFTGRDGVYFHLAEALLIAQMGAEALPYYERLIKEFEQSEYLEQAWARVAELKAAQDQPTR